jgi:integrase
LKSKKSKNSIPASGTNERPVNTGLSRFTDRKKSFGSPFGSPMTDHNKARLVIPAKNSKDQRWKIIYYVFDARQGKKVRKKYTKFNSISDPGKRKKEAQHLVREINKMLAEGFIYDPEQVERDKIFENKEYLSVSAAFNVALKSKDKFRVSTIKWYADAWKKFEAWLKKHNLSSIHIDQLSRKHVEMFLDHLIIDEKLKPRSRNNYLGAIRSMLNYLLEQELISRNVTVGIKSLNQGTGKNIGFNSDQQKELLDYMRKHKPKWLFPCQFMYYSLIRTNELALLKVRNVGMYDPEKIYVPKAESKNGHERHITIPPQLKVILDKMCLDKIDPDFYLFSKSYEPGPEAFKSKYIGSRFREQVLKPLNYSSEYTFYSWKHTGVTACWFSGMSKGAIMQQTGHRNAGSFETYIKSLGLFTNDEVKKNYPSLPG